MPAFVIRLFPLWALLLSALSLWQPTLFTPLKGGIIPLLMLVMFGMGMTLTLRDFARVWQQPGVIGLGLALQFIIMPLAAWLIGHGLQLESALIIGLVLVGASPGGTASNVICYLARGNVALSISLTLSSTLLAVLLTPLLTWLYVGQQVPVPVLDMLLNVLQIIAAPVLLGAAINTLAGSYVRKVQGLFPWLSVVAIVLIIAIIVALNTERLWQIGPLLLIAVILHNALGLAGGYLFARLFRYNTVTARTLAIEVGMQNSGLAVALALKYFPAIGALTALPGALFSIWHNLSGSVLAAWWSRSGR
ncbi:bile acid:sodium symporter family protein [Thiohalophilus thiocyanatoxydans]|uniref:BASS family bile acid:Na+ symporter n=1 Tax=Thiohalophilus thiocyanatoxydans TaxID=381308 RepID=A0A4R8IJP4_9GAMM|nr:bile acid:sodium symporter family protein [Thiohalophilus thiocyanatoxydans]TDY00956.1 BASS family bile acid:Na+ symporter [Thiohalophilus thiocyanatoxydans]